MRANGASPPAASLQDANRDKTVNDTGMGTDRDMHSIGADRPAIGCSGARYRIFRLFWLAVGCGLAGSGVAAEVAIIKAADILPYQEAVAGFKEKFSGQVTEYVLAPGDGVENALQEGLRKNRIDIMLSLGTDALALAKRHVNTVPVVYGFVLDPGAALAGMAAPERARIAGLSMNVPAHAQFTALLKIRPGTKKVGVVYDPGRSQALVDEARGAARALGMTLVDRPIKSAAEAIDAYTALRGEADVMWMVPDATAISPESLKFLMLFSLRNNFPVIGIADKYVKMGALFALSFDAKDIGRQAAELAIRLLDGIPAAPLASVAPRKLAMSINLKSATSLGISVPQDVIDTATVVYR
ncbi:MAG: ABC transporter substrate-binding protein [Gammaproteobacteria bacterium]